jgi:hypothetical protein
MLREERQNVVLDSLVDAVAVIALVGLVAVRDAETLELFDEDFVTRDQAVLPPDVDRDGRALRRPIVVAGLLERLDRLGWPAELDEQERRGYRRASGVLLEQSTRARPPLTARGVFRHPHRTAQRTATRTRAAH